MYDTYTYTTTSDSMNALYGHPFFWVFYWAVIVLFIVGMFKLFQKAGESGWKAIVPFYNQYTLYRIAGRNGWWFLLLFIPVVGLIVHIIFSLDLGKHFGKSTVFSVVGLIFFPMIGYLMLGYGDAKYVGPKHQ